MARRDEIIEKLRSRYPYLSSEFGVRRIGVFGSTARGTRTHDSDVDIVVEFARPIGMRFVSLAEYLETLLGRRVDILTRDGVRNIRVEKVRTGIERDVFYV